MQPYSTHFFYLFIYFYTFLITFPYSLHHHHNVVYFDGGQGAVVAVRHNEDINEIWRMGAETMSGVNLRAETHYM